MKEVEISGVKVKIFIIIALLAIIGVKYYFNEPLERVEVDVIKVIDGDTIVVEFDDGKKEKVRFIGVDTPEIGEEGYEEATNYTNDMLYDETVYLESDKEDRDEYGRLLRYVWIEKYTEDYEDRTINNLLKTEGHGVDLWIKPNTKYKN